MNGCRENIETFLRRDVGRWNGLQPDCERKEITDWLSFEEGEGSAFFGTKPVEYRFRALRYSGFPESLFFYFEKEGLSFIATEFWSFDRQECEDVLRELGPPPNRLKFHWREEAIEEAEFVYADKGLAIGVIPTTQLIVRVTAYPVCALETYQERYYNASAGREFPGRGKRKG